MGKRLSKLEVIVGNGVTQDWELGENGVVEIVDNSMEYPHDIHFIFDIKHEDGYTAQVSNCPCVAFYLDPEET